MDCVSPAFRRIPTRRIIQYNHSTVCHSLWGRVCFETEKLEVRGTSTPLGEDVAGDPGLGGGQLDFSGTGTLVYLPGKEITQSWPIEWIDSSGKTKLLLATPANYYYPRVSPRFGCRKIPDRERAPFRSPSS